MFVPTKLILISLLVFAVWYATRWLNRPPAKVARRRPAPSPQPQASIEDLVACPSCGTYVAAGAGGCGRPGCPQARVRS